MPADVHRSFARRVPTYTPLPWPSSINFRAHVLLYRGVDIANDSAYRGQRVVTLLVGATRAPCTGAKVQAGTRFRYHTLYANKFGAPLICRC